LNHPNIAAAHGLEKSGGVTALVMELVEGVTLAERIASGPLPMNEALAIALQIADAFDAAHQRGIIHRDLKPANVKVRPDGTVKVLDFGLAKASGSAGGSQHVSQSPTITTPAMTHAGVILGTAAYMSPEQARGLAVDRRADMWAFGVVLYEMLTGRAAFAAANVTDTIAAIVKDDPNWEPLPGALPPRVTWVLRACLQKDQTRRLRDMGDARLMLEGSFDVVRAPERAGASVRTTWSRRAALVAVGVVAGLVIAMGVVVFRGERARDGTVSRFEIPFRPGAFGGQLAFSPDGRTLVYPAYGPDGQRRLYRRSMDQFESNLIENSENGTGAFFSADGRWMGFVVGRTLKRVLTTGGPAQTIAELSIFPRGASWDGEAIVVGGGSAGLMRIPLNGAKPTVIVAATDGHELLYPQVLSGGRTILFTQSKFSAGARGAEAPEMQIVELDTGERHALAEGSAGRVITSGQLIFLRDGAVWAAAFDSNRLAVRGSAVPVTTQQDIGGFAVSDDGSLAYALSNFAVPRRMVWVSRTGREETIAAPPRGYTYPRLSPDGKRLAIDVRDEGIDIWVWNFAGETLTRLTFDPTQDEYPVWTRDSRQIYFASFRDKQWGVFAQSADGSGTIERVKTGSQEIDPLALSPDGRTLVARIGADVFTLALGQSAEPSPLLATRFDEINAEVSPDGRWLAYQSNESGRHEIYVRPLAAGARGLWQV
jgi:serine/threonine-protein kinase